MSASFLPRWCRLICLPQCALLLLSLGFLSGCATGHKSYYSTESSQKPPAEGAAPLAVIEFDERGDFWDPTQVTRADKMIKAKSAPILVTYVHGWRHDARPGDGDMLAFQNFLNQINQGPGLRGKVCGVFVGWRGASVQEEGGIARRVLSLPAALLSFWGRKKITDQMAGVPFTNTLWRLAATSKGKDGHSILIGHSFGGRIVEHTLGPTAIAQMNNGQPMPYNLTFLINPATESLYARQLKLALRNWKSSKPAIVALAARDDTATGTAWPLALLRRSGIRDRDYALKLPHGDITESQKTYVTSTVGNDQRQWTHKIHIGDADQVPAEANVTALNLERQTAEYFHVRLRGEKDGVVARCHVEELRGTDAKHQIDSKAYWVIPLEKTILSGHGGVAKENGIFSESMSDLMAGIIRQVRAVSGDAPIVPVSNPGQTEHSGSPPPPKFSINLLLR